MSLSSLEPGGVRLGFTVQGSGFRRPVMSHSSTTTKLQSWPCPLKPLVTPVSPEPNALNHRSKTRRPQTQKSKPLQYTLHPRTCCPKMLTFLRVRKASSDEEAKPAAAKAVVEVVGFRVLGLRCWQTPKWRRLRRRGAGFFSVDSLRCRACDVQVIPGLS